MSIFCSLYLAMAVLTRNLNWRHDRRTDKNNLSIIVFGQVDKIGMNLIVSYLWNEGIEIIEQCWASVPDKDKDFGRMVNVHNA